jgi:hypothetical protein
MLKSLLLAVVLTLAACSGGAGMGGSSAQLVTDVPTLVSALANTGASVHDLGSFEPGFDGLGSNARRLCVDGQEVSTYAFPNEAAANTVAGGMDPEDPSHIGNAIIEWRGSPRFWQAGSMLVLYLGADARTEQTVSGLLGRPFASGGGRQPEGATSAC